jgi:hypothetical protein
MFKDTKNISQHGIKHTYSHEQVTSIARKNNFRIMKTIDLTYKLLPRKIYILQKITQPDVSEVS